MRISLAAAALSLVLAPAALADDAPLSAPPRPEHVADGPLQALDYFIGDWVIDARWAWGDTLNARNEYRVGLGGNFVEVATIVRDNDGPVYERYFSVYAHDAATNQTTAIGFTHDGSVTNLPTEVRKEGDAIVILTDMTEGGTRIRQRVKTDGPDAYTWKVWMTPAGSDAEQQIMEGVWRRVTDDAEGDDAVGAAAPAGVARPINAALFDASGLDLRSFTEAATIDAPPAEVFGAWATAAGWQDVYAQSRPDATANIDLAIGGRYEWLFDGSLGSNGCQVLSYVPNRMISFTWNAPPAQPESRAKRTWVVVELEPAGDGRTDVTLTHLGFGDAEHWDQTESYFKSAWPRVLDAMRRHFAAHG